MPSEREPSDEVLELASADSRPDKGFDTEELDSLLDLAAEVQEKVDKLSRGVRSDLIFMLILASGIMAALLAFDALATAVVEVQLVLASIIGLGSVSAIALFMMASTLLRRNRALAREERKLEEVVDIAREVAQVMAHDHLVRPLTKARIRMRISEYPLARSNSRLPPVVRALLGTDL